MKSGEHLSGDFFSRDYIARWLEIIRNRSQTRFYCYTKEVALFRELVESDPPPNFWWVYSLGGTQDSNLDVAHDRVADVFPDEARSPLRAGIRRRSPTSWPCWGPGRSASPRTTSRGSKRARTAVGGASGKQSRT